MFYFKNTCVQVCFEDIPTIEKVFFLYVKNIVVYMLNFIYLAMMRVFFILPFFLKKIAIVFVCFPYLKSLYVRHLNENYKVF